MNKCKNCLTPLIESFSFGKMPIANNFLSHDSFKDEYFFEMKISLCDSCYLFQLIEQPNKTLMFHENYKFYSSLLFDTLYLSYNFLCYSLSFLSHLYILLVKHKFRYCTYYLELISNHSGKSN